MTNLQCEVLAYDNCENKVLVNSSNKYKVLTYIENKSRQVMLKNYFSVKNNKLMANANWI